ncbi:PACE efflux transporter [Psychrobacter sp.]|uniref:PACE efflux transporter n=1 Tax=Psychrobacter sp. TaxID=56811 RepID=UPI003F988D84
MYNMIAGGKRGYALNLPFFSISGRTDTLMCTLLFKSGALESWLITLSPLKRRILYVAVFEIIAIVSSTFVLMKISGGNAAESLPVAVMVSLAAVIWNFVYNTAFEAWESRKRVAKRTLLIRSVHALGFDGGLVLICIPIYMIWYDVGFVQAFMMEVALLLFFLVYTFFFTLIFDKIFTSPYQNRAASASA